MVTCFDEYKNINLNFGIKDGYRVLNIHVSLSVSFILDL